jgi:hypothetical protein
MARMDAETRTIARFEPVLGIVGGVSGGLCVAHFPMIGLFVASRWWYRATVARLINRWEQVSD